MRMIRYQTREQPASFGWVLDDQVGRIEGNPLAEFRRMEADLPLNRARLLPPILPGKIICVGRNYAAHAKEHNVEVPEVPLLFLKPPSAILGPGANIVLPPQSNQVEHEAELVVIIGKRGRWISPEKALEHVFGYTIGNDVTARDLQRRDGQWTRGKGFDTFCPIGPWIETEFDPSDALITCRVNDELRQMASTRDMIFSVPTLIAYASSVMTLEPGALLMTGTPAGVGPLHPNDIVEITIEGLGTLRSPVVAEPQRS
jgi:2-keto-4-pentenoate hydratase/2-oxohepta-3-ene-1,7-dioic acid hydratase in catechol pathway